MKYSTYYNPAKKKKAKKKVYKPHSNNTHQLYNRSKLTCDDSTVKSRVYSNSDKTNIRMAFVNNVQNELSGLSSHRPKCSD